MIARRAVLAAGLALAARPALALDPGVAVGRYRRDERDIAVAHAIALSQDNVEDPSDRKTTMRVLLSDREAPVSAIIGLAFPPVWRMARAGVLRGLLLEFDPGDRTSLQAVVLDRSEDGASPPSISMSDSSGLWSRLYIGATRIEGELKEGASETMAFRFSAPVYANAVVADLKGAEARSSDPVKVVLARAEALMRGDLTAVAALSTEDAAASLATLPPEVMKLARAEMPNLIRRLKAPRRVVIRRESAAVMIGPGEWASLALVNGVWKAAD